MKHHHTEGNPWDPANETDDAKDAENGKNDGGGVVVAVKIVDACADAKNDMEDAGDPDELFGKGPGSCEIGPRKYEGDREYEGKENDGICIEGEVVRSIVYTTAAETFIGCITL